MPETAQPLLQRLLRRIGELTGTDAAYLFGSGSWLLASTLVTMVSVFVLALAFARLVPKDTYGSYRYVLAAAGILALPTLYGINTALIQSVACGKQASVRTAQRVKLRWGTLTTLGGLGLAGYHAIRGDTLLAGAIVVSAVSIPLSESFGVFDFYLHGRKLFRVSTVNRIIVELVRTTALLLAMFLGPTLLTVAAAYYVPVAVLNVVLYQITLAMYPPAGDSDEALVGYGKHLTATNVIATIAASADRLLLYSTLGPSQVAVYSFAVAPAEQLRGMMKIIRAMALPRFSARTLDEVQSTLPGKVIRFALAACAVTAAFIVAAPLLYAWLFPAYMESVPYARAYSLVLIGYVYILPLTLLEAQKLVRKIYYLNVASALIELALLTALTLAFGLPGIIAGLVIASFATLGIVLVLTRRKSGAPTDTQPPAVTLGHGQAPTP
jgi:O-antigen/teichoic acid export membrane protein